MAERRRGALTVDVGDVSNFALAAFRQAITEWDPSGTFAADMRAMCKGFEHGPLPPEDRAPLADLILCAEQASWHLECAPAFRAMLRSTGAKPPQRLLC